MGVDDALIKGRNIRDEACAGVRMKLEAAVELDDAAIAHLQSCRECSAFFQIIENEVSRAASEKIFRFNRVKLAGSFAGRRAALCAGRKRSFFRLHALGFALIILFFAGFMWLASTALRGVKNSDFVELEKIDEIQKKTLVSYSIYIEKLNGYYDRIYEPIFEAFEAGDLSDSYASPEAFDREVGAPAASVEADLDDSDNYGGDFFSAELEPGFLAKNIGGEIGEFYSENLRYLGEGN